MTHGTLHADADRQHAGAAAGHHADGLLAGVGDVPLPALPAGAGGDHEDAQGVAVVGRGEPLPGGLPAALDFFNAELMHTQYLVGVLAALGCDVSREAGAVSAMARRGGELLAGAAGQQPTNVVNQ